MCDRCIFSKDEIADLDRCYNNFPYGFCIFKVINDGTDVDAVFAYVNDNLSKMLLKSREELFNAHYKDVLTVVDEAWLWQFDGIIKNNTNVENTRFVPESGRYLNAAMYKYGDNLVGSVIKDVTKDSLNMLTNTKNAYKEIYYLNFLDKNYFMIYPDYLRKDEQGNYRDSIEEHISSGSIYGEDADMARAFLDPDNVVKALRENEIYERRYRKVFDGNVEWCLNTFVADERIKGEPVSAILMIKNIDDVFKRELEQQALVEEALAQAESASKTKSIFLSNMSHDIRTPINAIIGFTAMAKKKCDNPDRIAEYMDKIAESGKHLLSIINDILDVSKIENGKFSFNEQRCSFKEIVESFKTIVMPLIIKHNHNFDVSLENVHDTIYVDSIRFKQVLLNLVDNAIKYTPDGGNIKLAIRETGYDAEGYGFFDIRISDNGIGISKEDMEHLFDPFFRSINDRNDNTEGTGLGLTICKNIVELRGGTLECKSELGKGTEFKILVSLRYKEKSPENPITMPVPVCMGEEDTEDKKSLYDGRTILVVDDNLFNRELVREILEDEGLSVIEAHDGGEAVELIKAMEPEAVDAILMDVRMPVKNGYEASREIRALEDKKKAEIPIIALTANAFKEDKKEAIRNGMNGHITKPIDINTITGLIAEIAGWK